MTLLICAFLLQGLSDALGQLSEHIGLQAGLLGPGDRHTLYSSLGKQFRGRREKAQQFAPQGGLYCGPSGG